MYKHVNIFLTRIETTAAACSLILLLLLSLLQIFLRNIFDFGYPEIDILNRHLLVICAMMGAVLAINQSAHIKTDALNSLLSHRFKRAMTLPLNLFSCFICLILSYYSSIFVIDEWQFAPPNEHWTLGFTLIYPVSFFLMATHFLLTQISRVQAK